MKPKSKLELYRMIQLSAGITFLGTLFSGPLAVILVSVIHPQPTWKDPVTYIQYYHPIQSITYYFGLLLLIGSILMIVSLYHDSDRGVNPLIALIFTTLAGGLISINYMIEAAYVPALVRNYQPYLNPLISALAVTNPASLFWVLEMWGYGFLGFGSLFAMSLFTQNGLEKITRRLFLVNGVISLIGVSITCIQLEWVLSIEGLISYAFWNFLYLAMAVYVYFIIRERRQNYLGEVSGA